MSISNLTYLQAVAAKRPIPDQSSRFHYPPPIAESLKMDLVSVDHGKAELEMLTDCGTQANPMGTIHGGIILSLADAAIGTAHATTLQADESFTSIDLQINFFRPIWNERIRASAIPVHIGKTVSRYICDVTKGDGKLVAQVASSVMTLRNEQAKGR